MGLRYPNNGGPICFESANVQVNDLGERDIPYNGTLVGVVVRANCDLECEYLGCMFDSVTTLYAEKLYTPADIERFKTLCKDNNAAWTNMPGPNTDPCPPPRLNQLQLEAWRAEMFRLYRPKV